eukprot:3326285-Prymnesium_polylepis.2
MARKRRRRAARAARSMRAPHGTTPRSRSAPQTSADPQERARDLAAHPACTRLATPSERAPEAVARTGSRSTS